MASMQYLLAITVYEASKVAYSAFTFVKVFGSIVDEHRSVFEAAPTKPQSRELYPCMYLEDSAPSIRTINHIHRHPGEFGAEVSGLHDPAAPSGRLALSSKFVTA